MAATAQFYFESRVSAVIKASDYAVVRVMNLLVKSKNPVVKVVTATPAVEVAPAVVSSEKAPY